MNKYRSPAELIRGAGELTATGDMDVPHAAKPAEDAVEQLGFGKTAG